MFKPLLLPVFAQVLLTFAVLLRMYQLRIAEMRARRIDPQSVASRETGRQALTDSAPAADNLMNLFEMPVLFYVAMLIALALMLQEAVLVTFAWLYVLLRAAHSFIHVSYNTVMHRFTIYVFSCVVLFALWMRLGWLILAT